jgi:hypothetical protein
VPNTPKQRVVAGENKFRLEVLVDQVWRQSSNDIDEAFGYIDITADNLKSIACTLDGIPKEYHDKAVIYPERKYAVTSLLVESKEFRDLYQSHLPLSCLVANKYGKGLIDLEVTKEILKKKQHHLLGVLGGDFEKSKVTFLKKLQEQKYSDEIIKSIDLFIKFVPSEVYKYFPMENGYDEHLLNCLTEHEELLSYPLMRREILGRYARYSPERIIVHPWRDRVSKCAEILYDLHFLKRNFPSNNFEAQLNRGYTALGLAKLRTRWLLIAGNEYPELVLPSKLTYHFEKCSLSLPPTYQQIRTLKELNKIAQKMNNCAMDYHRELSQRNIYMFHVTKKPNSLLMASNVQDFGCVPTECRHANNKKPSHEYLAMVQRDFENAMMKLGD